MKEPRRLAQTSSAQVSLLSLVRFQVRLVLGCIALWMKITTRPLSVYSLSLAEDTPMETIILSISATDADTGEDGRVTYNITGGNIDRVFKINTISGNITLDGPLDYENKRSYGFVVTATDHGIYSQRSSNTTINVTVLDVNDNAPQFVQQVFNISISELASEGTKLTKISATDSDSSVNSKLIFSISGSSLFTINSSTGVLSLAGMLDYETRANYTLTVTVANPSRSDLNDSATINVDVSNVINEPLRCLSSPCRQRGNCSDKANGYMCTCQDGYTGVSCETEIMNVHQIRVKMAAYAWIC
eukprot:m.230080 g.230080  ORF g.230080 m.230080 type:complete len:302 (+) comp40053_c0_seq6:445-1350(+)